MRRGEDHHHRPGDGGVGVTDIPPPRPGYNRDGWRDGAPVGGVPHVDIEEDPIIVNWPLVGRAIGVLGALAGFLVPASIIIWRIAL